MCLIFLCAFKCTKIQEAASNDEISEEASTESKVWHIAEKEVKE